jgi:hypothetical protein
MWRRRCGASPGTSRWRLSERYYGQFERRIPVEDVDSEKVSATFNNGLLTVTLPKVATTREGCIGLRGPCVVGKRARGAACAAGFGRSPRCGRLAGPRGCSTADVAAKPRPGDAGGEKSCKRKAPQAQQDPFTSALFHRKLIGRNLVRCDRVTTCRLGDCWRFLIWAGSVQRSSPWTFAGSPHRRTIRILGLDPVARNAPNNGARS